MGNDNSTFWFQTNKDAPNEKVVVVDVAAEKPEFKELIAEDPDAVLESAQLIRDDLMLLAYSQDVNDQLYLHELATGKRIRRFLPDFVGSLGVSGRRAHSRFFVSVTSYLSPGSVYECDFVGPPCPDWLIWHAQELTGAMLSLCFSLAG
jgi:prolyl oligopeptidase